MTIPTHIRDALDRLLDYAMPDEKDHYEEARHNGSGHIYEDMLALRNWLGPVEAAAPEYTIGMIGINKGYGDRYELAILCGEQPLATLIVPDTEIAPLLHAGNCFHDLVSALKEMARCSSGCITVKARNAARRRSLDVVKRATGGSDV